VINFGEIGKLIFDAAVEALGEGAEIVADRARHLAPVRHIFTGANYTIRYKRASEMEADRAIRMQLGLSVEGSLDNPRPRTARTKSPLRHTDPGNRWAGSFGRRPPPQWRQRRTKAALQHLADYDAEMASRKAGNAPKPTVLDRRGAYEVRSMRAKSLRWGHGYVGGRLRDSIVAMRANPTGYRADAWVTAGKDQVDYAKYMEFGTSHAAAHPFLRPALAESRDAIVSQIAAAVKQASSTGGSHTEITIAVRI
jgi:HK97 gp10 family phage protein